MIPTLRQSGARRRRARESPLKSDLVSWWSLEEASGTRADSHGGYDLTDVNTVTSATGLVGDAAYFVSANNEYLEGITDSIFSVNGGTIAISIWFNLRSLGQFHHLIAKDDAINGRREWELRVNTSDQLEWLVFHGGTFTTRTWAATLTNNTWYHAYASCGAGTSALSLNNATAVSGALGGTPSGPYNGNPLIVGARGGNRLPTNGLIDEVAFWRRALTAGERSQLYNSGDGVGYSNI